MARYRASKLLSWYIVFISSLLGNYDFVYRNLLTTTKGKMNPKARARTGDLARLTSPIAPGLATRRALHIAF